MRAIGVLLFAITYLIGSINPSFSNSSLYKGKSNLTLPDNSGLSHSKSDLPTMDRHFEKDGNFSYIPPDGWTLSKIRGFDYMLLLGPANEKFTSNVHFQFEKYPESLEDYVSFSLDRLKNARKILKFLSKIPINTLSGLKGYKVIVSNDMNGIPLQQTIYFLDDGNRKFGITYSRLSNEGKEFDSIIDLTIYSFQTDDGCKNPLLGTTFENALSRFAIDLPNGWKPVTEISSNDIESYVKGDVLLSILVFNSITEPGKCLEERANLVRAKMNQGEIRIEEFIVGNEGLIVDGNPAEMAVARGYSDFAKRIPLEYVMLAISRDGTIYQLNFIATGLDVNKAQKAIDGLIDDVIEIINSIHIE